MALFLVYKASRVSTFGKTKLSVYWELFHHENHVEIFADTFQPLYSSHRRHREMLCSVPHHDTSISHCSLIVTKGKWLMELTTACHSSHTINKFARMNHIARHETAPSNGPQVNYFPSFQTLWLIRHADSSAKFVSASQPEARHSPSSAQ
jgi:hypothetical protein